MLSCPVLSCHVSSLPTAPQNLFRLSSEPRSCICCQTLYTRSCCKPPERGRAKLCIAHLVRTFAQACNKSRTSQPPSQDVKKSQKNRNRKSSTQIACLPCPVFHDPVTFAPDHMQSGQKSDGHLLLLCVHACPVRGYWIRFGIACRPCREACSCSLLHLPAQPVRRKRVRTSSLDLHTTKTTPVGSGVARSQQQSLSRVGRLSQH